MSSRMGGEYLSRCAICGAREQIELHHLGGAAHAPYFTIPLCREHHVRVTRALQLAKVCMSYTTELAERCRRARLACQVFLWFVEEITTYENTNK